MRELSNKEKREFIKYFLNKFNINLKEIIRDSKLVFDEKNKIYILNNKPIAFLYNNTIVPTLILINEIEIDLPYIIVDMGAKERILNGADVFRPGIKEIDPKIKKEDLTLIISEDKYLIALGISLYNYKEIINMQKGKVVKNIHYYGDKIFKLLKS